jgi:hypothetical protein
MAAASVRQDKLYQELRIALAATSAQRLKVWGRDSAARLPRLAARRVKNLGKLLAALAKFTGTELWNAVRALGEGRFRKHIEKRAANAIDGTIEKANLITRSTVVIGKALFDDPKKNAPGVLALALGFLAGSGGVDGNGGVPDTDIPILGIGAHRSVFTHSIIAGTLVEGAILAVADLADVVCEQLPPSSRDPFWSNLLEAKNNITRELAKGASAGIAYHLAVDAALQPGAYHGLPGSMPEEAHQTLFALNAAAEGLDVRHKENTTGQKVVRGVENAGGVVAKRAAAGAKWIRGFGQGLFSGSESDKRYK